MVITLAKPREHYLEIKKSRFYVYAMRADTIEEALAFVEEKAEKDASHNAWAYKIGSEYRFFDDGEVSGTAGKPILNAIEMRGLDQVVVLVIRYFGGIKLGAGGLIRAYGGAAAQCLMEASKFEIKPYVEILLSVNFNLLGTFHNLFSRFDLTKISEEFDAQGVNWVLKLEESQLEEFKLQVRDLSQGSAILKLN